MTNGHISDYNLKTTTQLAKLMYVIVDNKKTGQNENYRRMKLPAAAHSLKI